MTRTVRLTRSLMAGGLLLAASGCETRPTCPPPAGWCGTIVITSGAEADVLLPPLTQQDVGTSLNHLIFEKLAVIGLSLNTLGDDDFEPGLADEWTFENARTISFRLSPRARWHDGMPVTASDVAFTFELYRDPVVAAVARSRLERIESVTARDERTVVFRFTQAYPEQFFDAVYHMWILPRHLLDSIPRDRLGAHPFGRSPVGSGPFRFVRWSAAELVELEGDSTYHRDRPGVPRIVWRFASGGGPALTQVLAGEADVISILPRREDRARVEEAEHLQVLPYTTPVYAYVGFNLRDPANLSQPHPLFGDRALRRALAMAVDADALVSGVFGEQAATAIGPVTPILGVYSDSLPHISHDSAAAQRAFLRSGWSDSDGDGLLDRNGRPLAFELLVPSSSSGRVLSAQVIQEQLRLAGVRVTLVEVEFNTMGDRTTSGDFDAFFGALLQDPSPGSLVDTWTTAAIGGLNVGRYSNPQVDGLIEQAQATTDPAGARQLWQEAITMINEDAPAIWIYVPKQAAAVHRRIENATIRPDLWSATLWKWRIDPSRFVDRDLVGLH